jgi:hypothetical protein
MAYTSCSLPLPMMEYPIAERGYRVEKGILLRERL